MNVDPRRYPNVNIRALETDDDVKAHATPNEDNTMLYRMFEDALSARSVLTSITTFLVVFPIILA